MTVIMYYEREEGAKEGGRRKGQLTRRRRDKDERRRKHTFGVSNFQRAMSMVIPRSRSAFSLSRTQAYLKDPSGVRRKIRQRQQENLQDHPLDAEVGERKVVNQGR